MQNSKNLKFKKYDLEERSYSFALQVRKFIQIIDKQFVFTDDYKQLLRSSGSIGANYIEANESLSRKDFLMRVKISRKETKETIYWLRLIECKQEYKDLQIKLITEAYELLKIFGSIVTKSQSI